MPIEVREIDASEELDRAFEIRRLVFCDEQGVSREEEFDGLDDICRQYLASVEGMSVGTARLRALEKREFKIERVAVLIEFRGLGVGQSLMTRMMTDAGDATLVLNAQFQTKGFYKGLGFSAVGEVFDEAGIDHVKMVRHGAAHLPG